MAFATNFFEERILNLLRNTALTGYTNLFIGLYLSNPTDTGQAGIEISYPEYQRQPITFSAPAPESGGIGIRNNTDILYNVSSQDAGQVRFIGISDSQAVGGGNMLLHGELSIPLDIRAQQQPSIAMNDILYFILGDSTVWFKTGVLNTLRGTTMQGFNPHWAFFDGDPEGTGTELSGGAYARPLVTFGPPVQQVGGQGQIANTAMVRTPAPTTQWGLWAWDGLMTAATGGNMAFKYQNPIPEIIHRNYVPQIPAGDYKVEVD